MKPDEKDAKVIEENGDDEAKSETATVTVEPDETATEVKEGKRKGKSWVKNIGSGMKTLRLRKQSDKKNEKVLDTLASSTSIVDPDYETPIIYGNNGTALPLRPQLPLPAIPTDSPNTSVPPSPSSLKALKKSSKTKTNASRLSLREHMAKAKAKKGEAAPAGISNGTVENPDKADPGRFIGEGLTFKAKLIGILEVSGPRGDRICQEALSELKMAVKAAGEHKQKVTINVSLDGLRVRDEKTGDCLYHHQVHKISFIAQDLTDTRAFGYIFGSPDVGHRFFGIKTEKSASQVVMSMRDLFQVVFDLKKKEIERAKQQLEMQQKFLATRAAETSIRTSHKSGIAETYIDGACSILGGGIPSSQTTSSAPAEADLLNLEVELTSLQEGLDNIHSTLIDTATSHSTFNRGSTASISSDPMDPSSASFTKYNSSVNSSFSASHHTGSGINATNPPYANTNSTKDPFGDSFDPFDGSKPQGQPIVSPFQTDPFTNVDPFAGTKFSEGPAEPTEFLVSDPFETPVGGSNFSFPESSSRLINRQVSITSNSSDMSSGKLSLGPDVSTGRPSMTSATTSGPSPNLPKSDMNFSMTASNNWTASFEDNFAASLINQRKNSGNGDIFVELDPLGTGRVKPFIDRKDFFQDIKNPPRKLLSELSTPPTTASGISLVPMEMNLEVQNTQLDPSSSSSPLPNSFSTNFNPVNNTTQEVEPLVKLPHPSKSDVHLRTSSIRAPLSGDTPPSYSPPPPPPPQQSFQSNSSVSTSVYFVNAPPKSSPPSIKKSPQLLRNMTIASAGSTSSVLSSSQSGSPGTFHRIGKQYTVDVMPGGEEIPNLTPPPRPPHTLGNLTLNRTSSNLPTALPRPHSGGEGRRQLSSTSSTGSGPPEPPPRPLATTNETFLSPPPLPPKKQSIGPAISNPILTKLNYNGTKSKINAEVSWTSNDLPLPLPSRKGAHNNNTQQQRYAYPIENNPPPILPPPGRYAHLDEKTPIFMSTSNLAQHNQDNPGLTMEAALSQVASLSLAQLAGKLQIPVEKLSSCTIQELAIKLTMMNLKEEKQTMRKLPLSFESNFVDDDLPENDFSTASAPATVFSNEPPHRNNNNVTMSVMTSSNNQKQSNYDRYAVFRELADSETVSAFSLCDPQSVDEEDDEVEAEEQKSRTLTSRESSSEKTLQADFDTQGNELSTMDDVTDVNFSDEEKSALFDEVVDLNLKAEWATFESNFDEQFVPLAAAFHKSEESPWDSDIDNNKPNFGPTDTVTQEIQQPSEQKKSSKSDHHSSQFDFQLFEKPLVSVESSLTGRRNSRGMELRSHDSLEPKQQFQRQSSGSSKHSEKSIGNPPALSSRNITTSDYSDSGKERERAPRTTSSHADWNGDERRRPGPDSRRNHQRKYSRESDKGSGSGRRRHYYYDDDDEGNGSRSPVDRRRGGHRRTCDDDYEDECHSTSSRHSRLRHGPPNKYYSQSLSRREREGRYSDRGRRPSESEKYSNHESDFDDSFEDERRRSGRGSSGYTKSERDHRAGGSSRPASSGGSVGGSMSRTRKQKYRDSSREYYYNHHRDQRESRHGHRYAVPYHHGRNREIEDDYEHDGRELSDYSNGEEGSSKGRRLRGRRRTERTDRDPRPYYHTNSPSWDSETSPSGRDEDEGDGNEMTRGSRLRRSDVSPRPRERERDRDRPSSSTYHGERLEGSSSSGRKGSRYQSDLSSSTHLNKSSKLSASEYPPFEEDFSPASQQLQHQDRKGSSRGTTPKPSETNSNKTEPNSNNKLTTDHHPTTRQLHPPESPFEDNFVAENNIFFPANFSSPNSINEANQENKKPSNQNGPTGNSGGGSSSGSVGKSENENSSPEIGDNKNSVENHHQQIQQVVRKHTIDTIHEVPDGEMKKSDSFNIFEREKDPFADDDFFT